MSTSSPRTAQEMYDYCERHNLGHGLSKSWDLKHFGLIEDALAKDEQVLTVFEGMHNYQSMTKHDNYFAYAITTKRFILAQKKAVGGICQTISLNNVNDITYQKKLLSGVITVDTIKETFNVKAFDTQCTENIHDAIQDALEQAKGQGVRSSSGIPTDAASQLIALKKLLDMGVISQKDFDTKKNQILGL